MKCPNCGALIPEGKLYCEKCGEELVVSTDIDIELEMRHTMSNIVSKEFGDDDPVRRPVQKRPASFGGTGKKKPSKNKYDDMEFDEDDNPSLLGLIFKRGSKTGWLFYVVISIIIVVVICIALKMIRSVAKTNSLDYQIEKAKEAAEDNNLSSAITYLEKASELDEDNAEYKFTIAEYYKALGKLDDAVYTLTEIAQNKEYRTADRTRAYDDVIALLKEMSDYSSISRILSDCDITTVLDTYSSYLVGEPEFSVDEGTYQEVKTLVLKNESNNEIYYTLDGSDPIQNGILYTGPIALEYGSYTVKAVSINDYDIPSETIVKKYLIDVSFTFSPEVTPESGEYEHAFFIEVEVPMMYTCYYTTDGTDPDKSSNKYTGPVAVPAGESSYKFVVYASDGTQSEYVERNYSVTLNTELDPATAVTKLNQTLIDMGYLDASGAHREGVNGTYLFMYSTIYHIEDMGDFYLVVEYIQDDFGNNKRTGTVYAIDCYNGALYTVDTENAESADKYILTPLYQN